MPRGLALSQGQFCWPWPRPWSQVASVLALASIIWPQPRVERGQVQDLRCELFQNSITLSIFFIMGLNMKV